MPQAPSSSLSEPFEDGVWSASFDDVCVPRLDGAAAAAVESHQLGDSMCSRAALDRRRGRRALGLVAAGGTDAAAFGVVSVLALLERPKLARHSIAAGFRVGNTRVPLPRRASI